MRRGPAGRSFSVHTAEAHELGWDYEDFEWLPARADWQDALEKAKLLEPSAAIDVYRLLADSRMDFARTVKLDRAIQRALGRAGDVLADGFTTIKLALLGSSTLTHLLPGIRVAGLRRGLVIEVYEPPYGTYWQELVDPASGLHAFAPTVVLLALDARRVAEMGSSDAVLQHMRGCWKMAKQAFACAVVQQGVMPVMPLLMGNQEHRLANSPAAIVDAVNAGLRPAADAQGVSILALDVFVLEDGIRRWHEPALWYRAKQEAHPAMSPMYGEQVARVVGALMGQSRKCLVLDLDHTLWGGGIGDDGLEGIVLGQGSATGEAHLELQRYAKQLTQRGVVLAVCSKNDEANARLPFERHPEMVLRLGDIACFIANWEDKATNLRRIAKTLNLGLDSLVFVDDNPVERGLVRRELPMVAVPEMPEDPAEYVRVLAAAGSFEGVGVTEEDRERAAQYAANTRREAAADSVAATDLAGYLAGLRMELEWRPFDLGGRGRIVQLINKTNQFNLTTRRIGEAEIERMTSRCETLTLQFRLKDLYGDNGMIGVVIAEPATPAKLAAAGFKVGDVSGTDLAIDTWLMSCRVLGRQVDDAMMNVLVEQVRARGVRRIFGHYIPTAKNAMVREHYHRMGFKLLETAGDGATLWALETEAYQPLTTQIMCFEAEMASV
jgi:FkbH-like protein